MKRKLFYFVRHGESILNAQGIRQSAQGFLSEKGIEQATATGMRLRNNPFQIIIASPYERTTQTAEIINGCFEKKRVVEYVDLLQERRNPTEIIGKSVDDPEVRKIVDSIDKSYHSNDYRFSDEENFEDLKARAKQTLNYLSTRPESFVLVVTHGIFLRMLVAYIIHGEDLNASNYNLLSFVNSSNNAGITVCQYSKPWFKPGIWKLIAWDDHAPDRSLRSKTI